MPFPETIGTLWDWSIDCRIILWSLEDSLSNETPNQFEILAHGQFADIAVKNRDVLIELIEAMQIFVYGGVDRLGTGVHYNVHQGLYDMAGGGTLIDWMVAYIEAPDHQRSGHRMLIDAYNASMYDKDFDMEYHNKMVQRFREWA